MPELSYAGEYRGPALAVHPESEPFWRGIGSGKLTLPECAACGTIRFPVVPVCYNCGSLDYSWAPIPIEGVVSAAVRLERATGDPVWSAEVPYITAQVDMTAGLRLPGRVLCDCGEAVKHGTPVVAAYLDAGNGLGVLCFLHDCKS